MKKFSELSEKLKKGKDDPCWKGYVQLGTKKKNGKEVPNCVPKENVEEAAGAYSRYTASEIKKRRDEREKRNAGTTQAQRMKNKMYGNLTVKLKDQKESADLEEKSVSQAQQKMMGMALAYKRGEMPDASPEVKKMANSMSMKDLEDFAKTKHKGLPAKKESVENIDEISNALADRAKAKRQAQMDKARKDIGDAREKARKDGGGEHGWKSATPHHRPEGMPASQIKARDKFDKVYNKVNRSSALHNRRVKRLNKEEYELDEWKQDSGWRKAQKIRKDRYGNTVKDKNVAKSLAKKAQKKTAEMDK